MSDIESASPTPAGSGEGIAAYGGQAGDSAPAGSVSTHTTSEQPSRSTTADPSGQTETTAAPAGKSVEQIERDYKALQAAYTKTTQAYAKLGDPKTISEERAILAQLREHPGFIDWVQAQIAQEQAGSNDPDTIKALQIVDARVQQGIQEAVAPLFKSHLEAKVKNTFSEMDKEFGQEWHQLKPKMNEILQEWKQQGLVSPNIEQGFTYKFVKSLYAAAAADDPQFAAKAYQKRLEQKQANSTPSQPGTAASASTGAPANSMREAYAQALRQLGRS